MKKIRNFIDVLFFIVLVFIILGMIITDYMPSKLLTIVLLINLLVDKALEWLRDV